jgi:hypothetical protein
MPATLRTPPSRWTAGSKTIELRKALEQVHAQARANPCPAAGDEPSNHSDILPANYLGALGSPSDKSLRHVASEPTVSPHYFSESC